jgi:hypothetical protein
MQRSFTMADLSADAEQNPQQPNDDERDFVSAGIAQDAIEADLLRRICEDAGIEALVDSSRAGMVDKLSAPAEGWRIFVAAQDLPRARELITANRAALEADPEAGARAAEAAEAAEEAGETVPSGQ